MDGTHVAADDGAAAHPRDDTVTASATSPAAGSVSESPPAATTTEKQKAKRRSSLPPPVDADEAERRKQFYDELARHRRAFGITGPHLSGHEPEHEDDATNGSADDEATNSNSEPHASEQFLETMASDFGPIEQDDSNFMRSFPRTFTSWATFDDALERYTRGTFQLLRTHATQATVSRNKSTLKYLATQVIPGTFIGHFYPERFEWYKKVLVCALCRATTMRLKKLRTSTTTTSPTTGTRGPGRGGPFKDTDAKVTAHLQPEADDSKRFVIDVTSSGAHNHRCDGDALAAFTHGAGRLDDPVLLSLVRQMRHDGKEPRDVKRFIYECTGKRCSTKDVHAIYQQMGTDDTDATEATAVDVPALDFFTDDALAGAPATAATASVTRRLSAASTIAMDDDDVSMSRRHRTAASAPNRTLEDVQQSLARLAPTLTVQEQAALANALHVTMSTWTHKHNQARAAAAASSAPAFQYLSPSPSSHMANVFDYRRFDDAGADLLMGLDAAGTANVIQTSSNSNSNGNSRGGTTRAAAAAHKRRRQS